MRKRHTEVLQTSSEDNGFWETFGSALAAVARRTGSSASACPLPEVREAVRELREWPGPSSKERSHSIAA
jgi:hypothetical protein